ncbi:hypothetical protein C2W64_03116 [Brevibacillus laterosporus]|nr:hypothetical protein C2W64_03116 [Brevibacillus laterosporus]
MFKLGLLLGSYILKEASFLYNVDGHNRIALKKVPAIFMECLQGSKKQIEKMKKACINSQ